uniref:Peptidase C39 domain-containing protein n=1 Tax=Klebsiella phage vB_Kpn2-P2 TaxID=3230849 RepID=A0AAU8EEH7_9VIRU
MRRIVHQTQPTPLSCIATCLAMLVGRKAHFVDQEFTQDYGQQKVDVPMALAPFNIMCKPHLAAGIHELKVGSLYLACVPSLMMAGMFHQVIIDTRSGKIEVFDPGRGYSKTTQYYVAPGHKYLDIDHPNYDRLAFPLRTWILDYELVILDDVD